MNGMNRVSSRSLTDFLNDSEAPPGYVYFIDGAPAIQIDLFEEFYTLFWLGSAKPNSFISFFAHILDDVKGVSPLLQSNLAPPSFEGWASIVLDRRKTDPSMIFETRKTKAWFLKENKALTPANTQTIFTLKDHLYTFIQPYISSAVTLHVEVTTAFNNREYQLALWSDTDASPKASKETGITSNLPITESLESLLRQTSSPAGLLPNYSFNYLIGEIKGHISDRRYF